MATVTKPLALDESMNTTEQTPRNVADVLAQGLDAIGQAIASGSGSGGHTIVNASGTDMTQRAKMQFVDAGVTDDSANNKTKVEVVQLIDDESELTNAPDGVYQGDYDDAPEDVLDASMVAYKDGSVEDALDEFSKGVVFPPTAYITTAGGSATASKDGFAGGTFVQSANDNRAAWITVNGQQVAYIGGASYVDMPMVFLYYVHAGDVIETRSGVGKYHILVP